MRYILLFLSIIAFNFSNAQIQLHRADSTLRYVEGGQLIEFKTKDWTNNKFIDWGRASMMPSPGKVSIFSSQGLLSTGIPEFAENAVPLVYLDARLEGVIEGLRIGQSGGLATLGQDGKIPMSMLNVSGLSFKGAWNPNTNTPALLNGTGNVGDFYKAGSAGSYNFGNGEYNFNAGDWVIFAAGVWQRLGSNELVYSVNEKVGEVVLNHLDVGALPNTYVPQWMGLEGRPNSPVASIDNAVTQSHAHTNKDVLDLLSVAAGQLQYNGASVSYQTPNISFLFTRSVARTIPAGVSPLGCNSMAYAFGGGYNNTGDLSTFTAPVAGIYRFDASAYLGAATATSAWVGINVTSSRPTTQNGEYKFNNSAAGTGKVWTVTGGMDIRLNAGDTVQGRVYSNVSVNIMSTTATWFSGRLIHAL